MMIYFLQRKYDREPLNCSFMLKDGPNYVDLTGYHVGDEFDLMVDVERAFAELTEPMRQMSPTINVHIDRMIKPPECTTFIHLKVVKRHHTFAYRGEFGTLHLIGDCIYVEAIDGFNEDLLLWFIEKKLPPWINEDELKEERERYNPV